MVVNFQEKYPWANIKKLPDFVLRLTNLAIHLTLNDSKLLIMHSGNGVNTKDIDIMMNVVSKAKQNEEESMLNYVFPIDQFELIKNEVTDKCIALKQENDELEQEVNKLLKSYNSEDFHTSSGKNLNINEEKLSKLNLINQKLSHYYKTTDEFLSKLNGIKNPINLNADDFNPSNHPLNITSETLRVCEQLHDLYKNLIFSNHNDNNDDNDDEYLYEEIVKVKKMLKEEVETYKTFLNSYDVKT
ncbi:hypothetical protein Phum_PHUM354420 [Pediculus humanus corporis]|uniref:Uncharacterized protein n=1 Tax=Pediculus humanus subsp. corporis TaxID=121224 RepID=E0VP87_PEDHC|nr:uncharacterized protein Phum_PHUM354420 [Pediculus humanus corporis]EEB15193.1 hypothetical protein Phum_PHUM354420 [Pediculus humanus corporis]